MNRKILTLCIIHKDDSVLLGMKKRGFGMGKWNRFGGKVDPGETLEEAAKRELFEEAGIVATEINKLGVLDFSWREKPEDILEVNIFKCKNFSGDPVETHGMKPQWFKINEIPFEKMWADDIFWMPLFLKNKKFEGKFLFDDQDKIVKHQLDID